jgi:hypothetical protein
VRIKLLTVDQIEQLLQSIGNPQQHDDLLFCTIMDPLEIADSVRKGRHRFIWNDFELGWHTFHQHPSVFVASLDAQSLSRSLFEWSEDDRVTGLWADAIGHTTTPNQTVCRLILRPSPENWWDEQIYFEMEDRFADMK